MKSLKNSNLLKISDVFLKDRLNFLFLGTKVNHEVFLSFGRITTSMESLFTQVLVKKLLNVFYRKFMFTNYLKVMSDISANSLIESEAEHFWKFFCFTSLALFVLEIFESTFTRDPVWPISLRPTLRSETLFKSCSVYMAISRQQLFKS